MSQEANQHPQLEACVQMELEHLKTRKRRAERRLEERNNPIIVPVDEARVKGYEAQIQELEQWLDENE